jgi:hypothetical protein
MLFTGGQQTASGHFGVDISRIDTLVAEPPNTPVMHSLANLYVPFANTKRQP